MKLSIKIILLVFCCVPLYLFAQQEIQTPQAQQILNKSSHNFFIENKGQWPKEVRYLARIGGMNAWITKTGVVYDYYQIKRDFSSKQTLNLPPNEKDEFVRKHTSIKGHVVNMVLNGANSDAKDIPSGLHEGYYNYFIGNVSTKWASNVKLYNEVLIQDIYPGIDIRYYFDNDLIRYDYIANPGADITQIKLGINGSNGYKINENGELDLKTSLGKITHGKLYAFQNIGNRKSEIACTFIKNRNGEISVIAENYDPAFALVIDPLVYSTFIGGSSDELGNSIAIDVNGNAFITGYTFSTNYPTSTGAYDGSQNGSSYTDVFVSKLNASGSTLVYSTFIGGSINEAGNSIAIDVNGNAFITGYTLSTDYPTTIGAYDRSQNGTNFSDVFVTKLNASGSALIYSTFIGGGDDDYGNSIAVDSTGNAFITGNTGSSAFPTTNGAYRTWACGMVVPDVFVTKLNASGSALVYSTYICGSHDDYGTSIAIDGSGNALITGYTQGYFYPTTTGAYDVSYNGGNFDVFVTKLNTSGSALVYSTFIGGSDDDYGSSIAIDGTGNAFVTGYTLSSNYPTTTGAYDVSQNGNYDVFVTKLNDSGSVLVYSTFIGGSNNENSHSIAIDSNGNSFITGWTTSTNYPVTTGAYDVSQNGNYDVFVTKLNASGSTLIYSSFFGGSSWDESYSIAVDGTGNPFVTGYTQSTNYPTTAGVYDVSQNGNYDVFVTKILSINQSVNINFSNVTKTNATCSWTKGGGTKRAVFVKQTTYGIALTLNKNLYYANDTFGMGSQIGYTGWFCVYNDTGSSVTLCGLSLNTIYRVMVCEYIGSQWNETYNTDSVTNNPRCFNTTYTTPSIQAYNVNFSNIVSNSFTASWNNGNGSSRLVFVSVGNNGMASPADNTTYTANTNFGSGTQIGSTGWYCVYNGTGNSVSIFGLTSNTTYRVMVCEYNGTTGNEKYNVSNTTNNPANITTDYAAPKTQSYGISFNNVTSTIFRSDWTKGNGTSRVVFIKATTTGTAVPIINNTYIADTVYSSGSQIGSSGWYCVYNDTGTSVTISNLNPNTTYRLMVCDYNGTHGNEKYNTNTATNNPNNQNTDFIKPATQAVNISFSAVSDTRFIISWTNGNGTSRVVFVSAFDTGTASPTVNKSYMANPIFGYGNQIGSTGWFCVYNDTGSVVNISNLQPNSIYRVMVCEYNGTPGREQYNTSIAKNNPVNQATDFAKPTIQASNITFSKFIISWTNGNGTSRVVFVCAFDTGTALPIVNKSYAANPIFGYGTQIGSTGWYCVYNDTGSVVNISNLQLNTTYRVMVCEYNGTPGREQYNTSRAKNNPANHTTDFAKPIIQASNITFSNISSSSTDISYTRGNGSACLVLITNGAIPYPPLQNNNSYPVSSQIGISGWYCKYNGTTNTTSLTGLHPATYRVMVCEYNGTSGFEKYLTDTATKNPNSFNAVSIKDMITSKIKIYPNPTNGLLRIENAKGYHLTIFNSLGESIYNSFVIDDTYTTDLNKVPDGIYFLKLEGARDSFSQKIILRR